MVLCKIIGTLVATQKNEHLRPYKTLISQPIDLEGNPIGNDILVLDVLDAGLGDVVLVVQEGQGAAQLLGSKKIPVHSVVVAIVDGIDVHDPEAKK